MAVKKNQQHKNRLKKQASGEGPALFFQTQGLGQTKPREKNKKRIYNKMKPFDLEKAKKGDQVCLYDGTPAKILDFDFNKKIMYKYYEKKDKSEYTVVVNEEGENQRSEFLNLYMAPKYAYAKIYVNEYSKELYSGKICSTIEEAEAGKDKIYPEMKAFKMARIEFID